MDVRTTKRICRLCGRECSHYAKSHIIPKGFFPKSENGNPMSRRAVGRFPKRMSGGIYDEHILCDDCEHRYFHVPDTYAIQIYRDGVNRCRNEKDNTVSHICRIPGVDRRLLRSFFASVLWRCSVSKYECLQNFSIGNEFEWRIGNDLMTNGSFDYVDALGVVFNATNQEEFVQELNKCYIIPHVTPNGYNLYLPGMKFCVSLNDCSCPTNADKRIIECERLLQNASASLSTIQEGKDLLLFTTRFPDSIVRLAIDMCSKSR